MSWFDFKIHGVAAGHLQSSITLIGILQKHFVEKVRRQWAPLQCRIRMQVALNGLQPGCVVVASKAGKTMPTFIQGQAKNAQGNPVFAIPKVVQ